MPRLLRWVDASDVDASDVDAVLVSHGHPDHCADLHPLLRARALGDVACPPLPVFTLPGAVDRVLALDGPGTLRDAYAVREFDAGERFEVGPLRVETWPLPHFVPNAGVRLTNPGGQVLAYTGDTGPSGSLVELGRDADLYIADASYPEEVPSDAAAYLSSARQAGEDAARAGARRLLLTHLPGTDVAAAEGAARRAYRGEIAVADSGTVVDLG